MKLFSERGFHGTTIQEIANKSGVSKGAFYLHFQSKEDLILNIYKYYYQSHMERMEQISNEIPDPMESLTKQIETIFNSILDNKDFIVMQMRHSIAFGEEIDEFIRYIKQQNFLWNSDFLVRIYGEQLRPFIVDATSLYEGIIGGYFKWFIYDHPQINTEQLAQFIIRRIDNCIRGLLAEENEPQITYQELLKHFPESNREESDHVTSTLQNMKQQIEGLHISDKQREEIHVAIRLLLEEMEKETPQPVVFKGMLSYFKDIPELQGQCEELERQLNRHLLVT